MTVKCLELEVVIKASFVVGKPVVYSNHAVHVNEIVEINARISFQIIQCQSKNLLYYRF